MVSISGTATYARAACVAALTLGCQIAPPNLVGKACSLADLCPPPYACVLDPGGAQGACDVQDDVREVLTRDHGLRGEYFATSQLTDPRVVRIDPGLYFDWTALPPHPAVLRTAFSARWLGQLMVPRNDVYTFHVESNDGVRVWIPDTGGAPTHESWTFNFHYRGQFDVELTAGKHPIRVEYFQEDGIALLLLDWASSSFTRQRIPSAQLSPP